MTKASPSLLVLALFAAAPASYALDVAKDDDVKLGLTMRLQARADVSSSKTAADTNFDVVNGVVGDNDPVDFYLRRVRFGLKGSYKDDYKFQVTFAADKAETKDQTVKLYDAYVSRVWKDDANGLTHELRAGQSIAWFNDTTVCTSSANLLFPSVRATEQLLNSRGNGVGYQLSHPYGTFSADIQNNVTQTTGVKDGMFYSARVDLTPKGEYAIAKHQESFLGKAGKGVLVGLDYGVNTRAANATTTTGYGLDALGHVDALTVLAEIRADKVEAHAATGATTDTKKQIWLVQAGYVLPLTNIVLEPALRFTKIDLDKDNKSEGNNFNAAGVLDYGSSGNQFEAGVNYYIAGNNNKLQLEYLMWKGEENAAGDKAKANILRAQWQLNF